MNCFIFNHRPLNLLHTKMTDLRIEKEGFELYHPTQVYVPSIEEEE